MLICRCKPLCLHVELPLCTAPTGCKLEQESPSEVLVLPRNEVLGLLSCHPCHPRCVHELLPGLTAAKLLVSLCWCWKPCQACDKFDRMVVEAVETTGDLASLQETCC